MSEVNEGADGSRGVKDICHSDTDREVLKTYVTVTLTEKSEHIPAYPVAQLDCRKADVHSSRALFVAP